MNKSLFTKILIIFLVHINASAIEKVVLFGDSLMAGYGLPKEQHLSIVLENNLKQAGLNIKKKETVSVVGESGSGKTSLIMLIGGLEKPTSGKIIFNDQDITGLSEDCLLYTSDAADE